MSRFGRNPHAKDVVGADWVNRSRVRLTLACGHVVVVKRHIERRAPEVFTCTICVHNARMRAATEETDA